MNNKLALIGNPNSGKTSLFNLLTGARQHVGNYAGVTVEKKEGYFEDNGTMFELSDLPGVYSLTSYSLEESVARDSLIHDGYDLILNIVDSSNLERNLYLTIQLLELGLPVVVVLNMVDFAKDRGIEIDHKKLSSVLNVPVVPVIARTGWGKDSLLVEIKSFNNRAKNKPLEINYGDDLENSINTIRDVLEKNNVNSAYNRRMTAVKLLEDDDRMKCDIRFISPSSYDEISGLVEGIKLHVKKTLDTYPEALISDYRYGYISSMLREGIVKRRDDGGRVHVSEKIDYFLTHRLIGPLMMALIIITVYQFTFWAGGKPVELLNAFFNFLSELVARYLPDGVLKSLLVSGIIDGVGGVLGFVPLIMFMFFSIAILEDTGYFARIAYMMDRVFRIFGLHGSSAISYMVSGGIAGGCAVPGVIAARTLKSAKERLATILTVPFMSCGAKLPIYAMLISAFFPKNQGLMLFVITVISWTGALLTAKLFRKTIIGGESDPFVMELPPYRLPTFKGLLIHTWERTFQYIKKAGTVILAISILIWAFMTFPMLSDEREKYYNERIEVVKSEDVSGVHGDDMGERKKELDLIENERAVEALKNSIAGRVGSSIESVTWMAGFDWKINIALIGGVAAKEVIVSTLSTAYSMGDVNSDDTSTVMEAMKNDGRWNAPLALSLMVFIIFYSPCFPTLVVIARETGSWKWSVFSAVYNTIAAFVLSVITYRLMLYIVR